LCDVDTVGSEGYGEAFRAVVVKRNG
jgi:hypothetical protein